VNKFLLASLVLVTSNNLFAQNIDAVINPSAVENIEKVLSSDAMRGRGTFTPDIDRAAAFIASQFKEAGLNTWDGGSSYLQPFALVQAKVVSAKATLDGVDLPASAIALASSSPHLAIDQDNNYEKAFIKAGDNFRDILNICPRRRRVTWCSSIPAFQRIFPAWPVSPPNNSNLPVTW